MTDRIQSEIDRAKRAELLLGDDLISGAFDELEKSYIEAWRATGALQTASREALWQALQIVGRVRSHLHSVVANGTLAKAELEELQQFRRAS